MESQRTRGKSTHFKPQKPVLLPLGQELADKLTKAESARRRKARVRPTISDLQTDKIKSDQDGTESRNRTPTEDAVPAYIPSQPGGPGIAWVTLLGDNGRMP